MRITGKILKEARIKQELSIAEVSMSTKINPKVLTAIEDGNDKQLPAKTFLKGFVRSYAMYLKLDVDTVMSALQQDLGEKTEATQSNETAINAQSALDKKAAPTISASPKVFKGLAAAGILILFVLIVTVKNIVEKYEREKVVTPVTKTEPLINKDGAPDKAQVGAQAAVPAQEATASTGSITENVAATAPTGAAGQLPNNTLTQAPTGSVAAVVAPTGATAVATATAEVTPAITNAQAANPQTTSTQVAPPQAIPAPTATTQSVPPTPTQAATVAPVVVEQKKPVEAPKVEVAKKEEPKKDESIKEKAKSTLKENEVILEALDKVDVTFSINDGPTTKVTLMPDQVHTIKVKGTIALDVSDGGALNIIQNGTDRGVIGDLGKPKKVRYP